VSTSKPHFAKNVFFGCIDDRLVESHLKFIIEIGGAFFPAVAGGGLAFVDPSEQATALKQVAAAYAINKIDTVYLESHTDCGAYRLAGIKFESDAAEVDHLYHDLDKAAVLIQDALTAAGASPDEVTVHVQVVDPSGGIIPQPQ
jgi:carbonic anhydrase